MSVLDKMKKEYGIHCRVCEAGGYEPQADIAKALIAVVIAHYSDPANVSDGMQEGFYKGVQTVGREEDVSLTGMDVRVILAAAIRVAGEEVK